MHLLFEAFHDAVSIGTNNTTALQQTASTVYFSNKDDKNFLHLANFFQLCQLVNTSTAEDGASLLKRWLEESYEYKGKEPVDLSLLSRAEKGEQSYLENEQAAYRNLFHLIRAGKLIEAYEYCLHVLQRPWLAIVMQPAIMSGKSENKENAESKGLWRATLTSMACTGDKWQKAFYGALASDLPSVQPVIEHPLDSLWACANSNNVDVFYANSHTFEGFYAQVCVSVATKNWTRAQSAFETFIKSKTVLDSEAFIAALMGVHLAADSFWEVFISLWLASSEDTKVEETIYKLPYVALVKDQMLQQKMLAEVLYEECLPLDRTEIFRISTNCKKYCSSSHEPALQLMFQRALAEADLDAHLLLNLMHFTSFPLLTVDRFALELVLALCRKFLLTQNIASLKALVGSINANDLLRPENPLVRELACYSHLTRVLLVYEQWREEMLKEPKVRESSQGFERILWERQHAHWEQEIAGIAEMVHQAYQEATSIGWLDSSALNAHNMLLLTSEAQRDVELGEVYKIGTALMDSIMHNVGK